MESSFFTDMLASGWNVIVYFFDVMLHIDVYLKEVVNALGIYVYVLLFLIIFCETGLVVTPFLPGDSLLFAAGTLAGAGLLYYTPLVVVILSAAIIGDAVNFHIGMYLGPPIFRKNYKLLKRKHLEQAQAFYEKHGGKAIMLARFIPIVRTFAPFVAGVAKMNQGRFLFFNVFGACIWVFSLVTAGYFLGNLPVVQRNFSLLVYAIILISIMPIVVEWVKHQIKKRKV